MPHIEIVASGIDETNSLVEWLRQEPGFRGSKLRLRNGEIERDQMGSAQTVIELVAEHKDLIVMVGEVVAAWLSTRVRKTTARIVVDAVEVEIEGDRSIRPEVLAAEIHRKLRKTNGSSDLPSPET